MKTIGMLGGMSFESSLEYYKIMNEEVNRRLGKAHSAKLLMYSFDFQEMKEYMEQGNWKEIREELIKQALNLKKSGADFIVICTNTMHLMAGDIEEATGLEVVHIADVTGKAITEKSIEKVLLLGTKFTMESTFYSDVLKEKHHVDVIVPDENDRKIIHDIIFDELVKGLIRDESKNKYINIIKKYDEAQGVILGCTEIPLLVKQSDVDVVVFDTTSIHSLAAIDKSLE